MDSAVRGLNVETLNAGFGAEITGIDLSAGHKNPELMAAIESAFLQHHVVAIRNQKLDVNEVVEVSRRFGPLEPHVLDRFHHPETPLVLVLSNRVDASGRALGLRDAGSFWHSDVSFKERPARATLLYAIEVPEQGGDTLFCNMIAAFEALPEELKQELEGRFAVHDYANRDRVAHRTGTQPRLDRENLSRVPPVRHPVIRRHPVTGRNALYVNPTYTVCIEGMTETSSNLLLKRIFDHCLEDRFRLRYRWRAGDVVIWDNAAVMHAATTQNLDPRHHRTLWRTIIVGGPVA